jgi:hypothetical protein
MAKLTRLNNRVIDLDAIQQAQFTEKKEGDISSLHLILTSGVSITIDQLEGADKLWELINERLTIDWIDGPEVDPGPLRRL